MMIFFNLNFVEEKQTVAILFHDALDIKPMSLGLLLVLILIYVFKIIKVLPWY